MAPASVFPLMKGPLWAPGLSTDGLRPLSRFGPPPGLEPLFVLTQLTEGSRPLRRLGPPPGLEPPPGLTELTCPAEAIKEEECPLRFRLPKRVEFEGAGCVPAAPMVEQVDASLDRSYDTSTSDPGDDSSSQAPPSTRLLRLPQSPAAGWPEQPSSENANSERMSYLAEIAAETIKKTTKVTHIHHHRERRGWSVIARVPSDELVRFAEPLLAARQEVFRHMRVLPGTIPLRVREKMQGFCINLGFVDSPFQLCWDVAKMGKCCRGQSCNLEHPRNIQQLFVVIKGLKGLSLQGGEEEQESEQGEVIG
uniref:C3H1-type domain-containing protein n=1 Tax=Alexandrium monilatum TaxID=311494 RepID=A0A7S4SMF2_9DINO